MTMGSPTQPAPEPDAESGAPRPPQGPVEPGWRPVEKAKDYGLDDPPPGKGPALEWFADTKSTMWATVAFVFVLLVAFGTWYWVASAG